MRCITWETRLFAYILIVIFVFVDFVYDRNQNDIIEVNKTNYETCNAEHPVHNYTTGAGRDVVPLNVTHDRYFISSKGSCYGGMKLPVHLTKIPPPPRAAPAKSHSSRFTVLRSQFVIPTVFAIAAIWDSLLLRVWWSWSRYLFDFGEQTKLLLSEIDR